MSHFVRGVLVSLLLCASSLPAHAEAKSLGKGKAPALSADQTLLAYLQPRGQGGVSNEAQLIVSDLDSHQLFSSDLLQDAYKMKFNPHQSHQLAVISDEHTLWVFDLWRHADENSAPRKFELGSHGFNFVREHYENAGLLARRQSLEFSRDGRFLAVRQSSHDCSYDQPNQFALIELDTGKIHLRPDPAMTGDFFFSADSKTLFVYDLCDGANTLHRWNTQDPSQYTPVDEQVLGVRQAIPMEGLGLQALRFSEGSKWYTSRIGIYDPAAGKMSWVSDEYDFGTELLAAPSARRVLAQANSNLLFHRDGADLWLKPDGSSGLRITISRADFATSDDWQYAAALGTDQSGRTFMMAWALNAAPNTGVILPLFQREVSKEIILSKARVLGLSVSTRERTIAIETHDATTLEIFRTTFGF